MNSYHLDHLQYLETEAIHIMREVAAEFERPALLFSGGKDSICLLRLAEKAFRPSDIPMPFLNVETGHEFPELIEFRDRARQGTRRQTDRPHRGGRHRQGHRQARARRNQPQQTANSRPARRDRGISIRLRHRRRAARRGKSPRQGTFLQLPRLLRPVGPEKPAPGNLEPLQRPRESRRKHARVSALQLDGNGRVGIHQKRESWQCRRFISATSANASAAAANGCRCRRPHRSDQT